LIPAESGDVFVNNCYIWNYIYFSDGCFEKEENRKHFGLSNSRFPDSRDGIRVGCKRYFFWKRGMDFPGKGMPGICRWPGKQESLSGTL